MIKLLAYPLTIIYYFFFGLTLLIFHPIQWVCFNVFGYQAHKKSVDFMNLFLMRCLHILGSRYSYSNPHKIDKNQPLIIVANHQSMNDVSVISCHMRAFHPKFISKIELGKSIPSVSYNLRHGGSLLIDRKKPIQTIKAIKEFGIYIERKKYAAVIFPEGTRSKNGVPKEFQIFGLLTLFKEMPSAIVVPITINNSWKTICYGKFPMGLGTHITFMVHKPLKIANFADKKILINSIETTIKSHIKL